MADTILLAVGGIVLGLMVFSIGYQLIASFVIESQKQTFLEQFSNINEDLDSVCSQEPGNFLTFDLLIPSQVRVFYTTDKPDDVLPTVSDLIKSDKLSEGDYLCFQFKSEQFNRCSKLRCRTRLPHMGTLEDYNDFQIAVNKILGRPLVKEYEVTFKRTSNAVNLELSKPPPPPIHVPTDNYGGDEETTTTLPGSTTTMPPRTCDLNLACRSKLGIQTQFQKSGVMEFVDSTKPSVVKLNSDYGKAEEIKQTSPCTFIVGRIVESAGQQPTDGDAAQRARDWFNRNRGTIESTNSVDCWEGYNEPVPGHTAQEMQWMSSFEVERIKLLNSISRKACIGSFSAGNPDLALWSEFKPALEAAKQNGGYLSLHEYCSPSMQCNLDGDTGWLTLRYRKVYRQYLQPNNLEIPLVITETGIDSGGCEDNCGWRAHTDASSYLEDLKWYDSKLKEDSYVVGAAIFHYGQFGWGSFEIYPDLTGDAGNNGPLVSYMNGLAC